MNRLVKIGFGSPVVVAALQSPHLLNIWRNSRYWNLYYELLGDHEGFTEAHEIRLPCVERENLHSELVSAAIVTSPLQLKNALNRYPASLVFWLVHTGCYPNILPIECVESIHGIITLTEAVMRIQLRHKPILGKKNNFVITPFYKPAPIWRWSPNLLWTIRSRPAERNPISKDRHDHVISGIRSHLSGISSSRLLFFGQDSPDGYINKSGKIALYRNCSGYISALPKDAGFGLAEHEAMAHGVPVIGSRWGDIDAEISCEYPSLNDSEDHMIEAAVDLCSNKATAELASKLGLKYIREFRSKKRMNVQIKCFSDFIRSCNH